MRRKREMSDVRLCTCEVPFPFVKRKPLSRPPRPYTLRGTARARARPRNRARLRGALADLSPASVAGS